MAKFFLNGRHKYGEPISLAMRIEGFGTHDDIRIEVAPGDTLLGLSYDEVYETIRWQGWVGASLNLPACLAEGAWRRDLMMHAT